MDAFATQAANMAQLERRIRILENSQKSGLGAIQTANGTVGASYTTYGAWSNLAGDAPEITMSTGSRVVILAQSRIAYVGEATTPVPLKARGIQMGVGIDDLEPHEFPLPVMSNGLAPTAFSDTGPVSVYGAMPTSLMTARPDLTPGEHTFRMLFHALEDNPAGTDHPLVTDTSLIVIPLGWA